MHDVVVVGAGPGGSTTAHFLARHGLDVLLLDKSNFPRDKTCGDGLTPRALHVLDELGVLQNVEEVGFRMEEATVFAPGGSSVTTRVPDRPNMPPYMLAVPRLVLDDIIRERAVASGARFQEGVHVTGIEQLKHGVIVMGKRQRKPFTVKGRMVVIAIGASVKLLLNLGILSEIPRMILAARTYYEDLRHLSGRFEFHFDGVPLPGYGWVFPLSDSSANIGAGILSSGHSNGGSPSSGKVVLGQFLQLPMMQEMLATARQLGPVKGFPLRTDFATAPTYDERLLLVGEAAGLVNPLTGEGVDLAMESGEIAARHLIKCFETGDFSRASLSSYDQELRAHFQRLFVFSGRIRNWYLNKPVLNRLVYVANRREALRTLFTDIVLGNSDAGKAMSLKTIMQIVFTR